MSKSLKVALFTFCTTLAIGVSAVGGYLFHEHKEQDETQVESPDEKQSDSNRKIIKIKINSLEEIVKNDHKKYPGLFDLYQNSKDGKVLMVVKEDQLDKEYIYFTHTVDSTVESGTFRGEFRDNFVFKIEKNFNMLYFKKINTKYYFDPESKLSRSKTANIPPAVLASIKIKAESSDKKSFIFEADDLFLNESLASLKSFDEESFKFGSLSSSKTHFQDLENYPNNTVAIVNYVFEQTSQRKHHVITATDPRYISVQSQHTILEMPQNNYKPRFDDARIGYFTERQTDLLSDDPAPYRDMINRWHLVKKDPSAKISEPVEPIVYWIENSTPVKFREIIKKAGESWNRAFETAGFKNAFQVKIQPEDADWNANDIRYNVLRWTSSPNAPFYGYGPSFTNPRTGQILAADIMLEYSIVTNHQLINDIYSDLATESKDQKGEGNDQSELMRYKKYHQNCLAMKYAADSIGLGKTIYANAPEKVEKLIEQELYYLILHEIGHTLGLNHNMRASHMLSIKESHDESITREKGLVGSVMDYPFINFAPLGETQGDFAAVIPGPYDHWAIAFGYDPDLDNQEAREKLLSESTKPEHAFGNDADDMRSSDSGIDPRIQIYDFSNEPIQFAINNLELANHHLKSLPEKFLKAGESKQKLVNAFNRLMRNKSSQYRVMTRFIGGIYLDRSFVGQKNEKGEEADGFRPVDLATQQKALDALDKYLFAKDAHVFSDRLLKNLKVRRRGYDMSGRNEDPHVHMTVLNMQKDALRHMLHPKTLRRLLDSSLYGKVFSLEEYFMKLTRIMFNSDLKKDVNTFRKNLQIAYVRRVIKMLSESSDLPVVTKVVFGELNQMKKVFTKMKDTEHSKYLVFLIDTGLETYGDGEK